MEIEVEKFYLLLHPRPAYIVGAGRYGKVVNFMAASWVTPVAEEPPRVAAAIGVESYTHELIKKYGEFTINIYPLSKVDVVYTVGSTSGRKVNKVRVLDLKVQKGEKVLAPKLAEALGVLECKVAAEVDSEDTTLFIGEVVYVEAKEKLFNERRGWDFRNINIPLHNWGRGFYSVGKFVLAKKR